MLYEYPAIFYMIEEAYRISFPIFGRIIQVASLFDVMMKSSVFLAHIITNYGDKDLPVPTAVSSIPNEEELVVLPPTEIIEPLINELLLIFFLEGVFYFCFYIWHLKAIPVFRIALRWFLCDFQFVFRSGGVKNKWTTTHYMWLHTKKAGYDFLDNTHIKNK